MADDGADAARPAPPPTAPVFIPPKQVSRPKTVIQQEEELGPEPKLGDFENVNALSISEARAVMTAVHNARKKTAGNILGGDRVHNESEVITKFLDYFDLFARFKQNENLHALSALIDSHPEITSVEKAQLGSLCCDTADEAKTLIPSLANKISDATLTEMLDEMQKLQDRFG